MTSVASMQLTASGAVAVQIVPDDLSNRGRFTPLPSIPNLLCYQRSTLVFCLFVAGVEGFEPPTIGFGDRCSTNWNYTPKTHSDYRILNFYPTTQILVTSTL